MLFSEFLKDLATQLPFGVDFNVRPSKRKAKNTLEVVDGIEIPIYNDVSVAEKWFFEIIDNMNQGKAVELQVEMKQLSLAFMKYVDDDIEKAKKNKEKLKYGSVDNLSHAIGLLFRPSDLLDELDDDKLRDQYVALLASTTYENFLISHTDDYTKLANLSQLVQTAHNVVWVKTTFFLKSRFDGEWEFEDTATLTVDELAKFKDIMELEANKGVKPEVLVEETEELSDEEQLKKTSKT